MNLTHILFFGEALLGGGDSGTKPVIDVSLELLDADEIGMVVSGYSFYSDVPVIEAGNRYLVTTDSGTTECVAIQLGDSVFIGNTSALGGEDTGESFLVGCMPNADEYKAEAIDFNCGSHMTVTLVESGGGTSGGSGGAIAIHRNCTFGELSQLEKIEFDATYFKISDNVPTHDQMVNSAVFSKNYNDEWVRTAAEAYNDGVMDALVGFDTNGNVQGVCAIAITPEIAEMMAAENGIECSAGLYITGQGLAYSKFADEAENIEYDFYMVFGLE